MLTILIVGCGWLESSDTSIINRMQYDFILVFHIFKYFDWIKKGKLYFTVQMQSWNYLSVILVYILIIKNINKYK